MSKKTKIIISEKSDVFDLGDTPDKIEIQAVELDICLDSDRPYKSLGQALRSTRSLKKASIQFCMYDAHSSRAMFDGIIYNESIEDLKCDFFDEAYYYGACPDLERFIDSLATNKILKKLAFGSVGLYADSCKTLSESLKKNQSLTSLDLSACCIQDPALEHLIDGLNINKKIKALDLSCNDFGPHGCDALGELVKNNTTLTYLNISSLKQALPGEWKEFFRGLKENKSITELNVSESKIAAEDCQFINEALKSNKTLMHIDMNGNKIGSAGLNLMLQDLHVKGSGGLLSTINLRGTKLDSACCEVLCNYVSVNENMMELDLSYNNIQAEGCKWIGTMLANNKTLTVLNMTNNKIGSQGAQWLASGLRVNRRLIDLVLQDCGITSDGCTHIAHALALNPCVMHVNLNGNDIGAQGCSALVTAMHTNHSVTALSITKDRKISDVSLNELIDAQNRNKIIHRTQLINVMTTLINMARMTDDIMSVFPLEIWQRIFKQCVCGGVPGFDQIAMDLFTGLVDCRDIAQLVKMKIVRKRGKSILVKPSISNK